MNIANINTIYFLGIGGIGMSALARYFHSLGKKVSGYDKTSTELTQSLEREGITVNHVGDAMVLHADIDLVVYTPAIPTDDVLFRACVSNGLNMKKRSEVLGLITQQSFTVAVAGTHGKTTTSSIAAHLLKQSPKGCNAFLGGIAKNYDSNLLLSPDSDNVVVEADEYDRSFLTLFPDVAIITSMDADHLDIYGTGDALNQSFNLFANQVKQKGLLVLNQQIKNQIAVSDKNIVTYSATGIADYCLADIQIKDGEYVFAVATPNHIIKDLTFGLPGRHNVENALAAITVADQMGVEEEDIRAALKSFSGIKRRFEYVVKTNGLVYIDDYAHHPVEIEAAINSAKEFYPDNKITGVFQPHLYSRTKDFADEFAKSLDLLNEVILLDIYPARELPIEGVNAEMLLRKISIKNKSICKKEELVKELKGRELEVLLTMGAGDIGALVDPIKNELLN